MFIRRISRLNPGLLYSGAIDDTLRVNECSANGMKRLESVQLYGDSRYCRMQFDFIFNKATFNTPTDTIPFGILPLLFEAAFRALHRLPGDSIEWSHGYNMQDIAFDIQKFFNLITPLELQKITFAELDLTGLRAILDHADKSPVFIVDFRGVYIVTSKVAEGWKGYDIKNLAEIRTWTESGLETMPYAASLIYTKGTKKSPNKQVNLVQKQRHSKPTLNIDLVAI